MILGRARRLVVGSVLLLSIGIGCSAIVSSELPAFECAGNEPSACPTGTICDPSAGRCVALSNVVDADIPETSDDGGNGDSDAGPLELGAQCRVDVDCQSKLCGTSTILTPAITLTTGPICTTTCCTSSQCPAGFVCFGAGTGGNYCVPAALAQRSPPESGGKDAGATCSKNNDCRSGNCTAGRCLDTCCMPGDCTLGSVCRLKSIGAPPPAHDVWVCAAPETGATKDAGDECLANGDCKSDACIGFMPSECRPPCCGALSCAAQGFNAGHCLYGQSGDYFKFCFFTTNGSRLPLGATCNADAECQRDYCDAELKKCAEICCRDADCPAGQLCRPSAVGTPLLRCVARN